MSAYHAAIRTAIEEPNKATNRTADWHTFCYTYIATNQAAYSGANKPTNCTTF